MAKPRKFRPEFKAKIALAALRGDRTLAALCRQHRLSDTVLSRWKPQLLKQAHGIVSSTTPDDALQPRIDDLERRIGQQAVELDAAKKLSAMLHGRSTPNGVGFGSIGPSSARRSCATCFRWSGAASPTRRSTRPTTAGVRRW